MAGVAVSNNNMELFAAYLKNEAGATAIEYALMLSLFSIAMIVSWSSMGDIINSRFYMVEEALDDAGIAQGSGQEE